ncbi:MAG TPA: hypothetical protein DDX39_07105 [Bacteroidales bacterium]|nr:MAG: hypothetical protein A2W98_12170 [Bacteroidetes bacterium GWF2_33_38]OFY75450.1 MAG: hypothetical protein A2265_11515 [Bacteroidetes bacterium RIFOXYA12_FULL_33_9]OFY91894.1 MAG: hypothetical protein A2236_06065 [Bacteroidetes bacterium RIFOXYA2_FULL_33_7]HBF88397.1 hypothetical protein [Bacteroidales bacterium]
MKFLSKNTNSEILSTNLKYKENAFENNRNLREKLIAEQKNFCAYTEKYLEELDSPEVEHFNSQKKYNDDYYNYYVAIRKANLYKKDEKYKNASFFTSLFFQDENEFKKRIRFADGIYYETNKKDIEAKELIDFLGFNNSELFSQRKRHSERLTKLFKAAQFNNENIIDYFKNHKQELSFITVLEYELQMNLSQLL